MSNLTKIVDEDLKQYHAVLLNGCAVLGAAHAGFLMSLENAKKLRFLKVVSGTSVGSIIAMFFLAQVPLEKVISIFREQTLLSLLQPMDDVMNMLHHMGIASSEKILHVCAKILHSVNVDAAKLTFRQLRQCGKKIDLIIVASQYNAHSRDHDTIFTPAYFSTRTTPDMLVFDAIRLSINIPILFTTPKHKDHYYLDGVLTDELPFEYISKQYGIDIDDMLGHAVQNTAKTSINKHIDAAQIITSLYTHCLSRVRATSYTSRVLKTIIEIDAAQSELIASPEMIDYFVICGIKNTRQFTMRKKDARGSKTDVNP